MDYEKFVPERVARLRQAKGVSARDMSLTMGQNVNYINHIENGKMEPSLTGLYYICDYFKITPQEFFDEGNPYPDRLKEIIDNLKYLDENALINLSGVIKEMVDKKKL